MQKITAIIPAYNERDHILDEIKLLKESGIENVIVSIDANSSDDTDKVLTENNIPFVKSPATGYDTTMQTGVDAIATYYPKTQYVLFTSTGGKYNYSDLNNFYSELENGADMVMADRISKGSELLWHQNLGTKLVLLFINIIFRTNFKDIGPFRIIDYKVLLSLNMQPAKFRYTTEMLVKCLATGKKVVEVNSPSKMRVGKSKITGNIKNSLKAGLDMFSALKFIRYTANND